MEYPPGREWGRLPAGLGKAQKSGQILIVDAVGKIMLFETILLTH